MREQLKELHKKARLERDAIATEAYGAALAAIQEGEVRENTGYDEAKIISVVEKEAGKFQESAEAFAKAGREEKAAELTRCAELLTELLPAKLEEDAYPDLVAKAIEKVGATSMRDMGKVMAALKKAHGSALDSRIASSIVKETLT